MLIESMLDAVVVLDLEGKIVQCNRAAEELSGYSQSQLAKLPVAKLFDDSLSGVRTRVRRQVAEGHAFQREESWMVTARGQRIPVSLTASPVIDDNRNVSSIIVVARDAREMRQQLLARDAELERHKAAYKKLEATLQAKLEVIRAALLVEIDVLDSRIALGDRDAVLDQLAHLRAMLRDPADHS